VERRKKLHAIAIAKITLLYIKMEKGIGHGGAHLV
jgi:hypothetical protein